MISVVMATRDCERDLIGALSPLVPGSVEGLIHELVVSDGGSTDGTLAVLEEAGAVIVDGGVEAAAARAKGPWLLVIQPTSRLTYEWIEPVRRHLQAGGGARRLTRGGLFSKAEAVLVRKADYQAGKRGGPRLRI
jgi:glycosyltransferase involved in cell wall biosynthesis